MSILYTITAYPPSIGGAQLHLHEFVKRVDEPVGVLYQWDENRSDWLLGSTLRAPEQSPTHFIDHVPVHPLTLSHEQREALRGWVYSYWLLQGHALDRLSSALLERFPEAVTSLLPSAPRLVHNSRVGREALTLASLRYARRLGLPFVFTPNHHHHWQGWRYRHFLRLYREADALIAMTPFEMETLRRLGVPPDRIHVLGVGPILAPTHNGSRFRAAYQIPEDAPLVLFLGQKYRYKRFELLLKVMPAVWKTHPNTRFVFIGPRTPASRRIFSKYSHPNLLEIDSVDLQTKTDALAASDILCMPSSRESFGGVYLEAWALHKPVIGGDAPALAEIIEDGVNGFRVGNEPDQLARHLCLLLNDPDRRTAMGLAGEAMVQRYQWNDLAAKLQQVYDQLL